MAELRAQRTLVKSPPELWAQLSDPASLSRHLGEFGEIRITRVVPEETVAWEGERASGTVELSASGWGTKVTLRAQLTDAPAPPPEPAAAEAQPSESRPADAFELLNSLAREPLPQTPEPADPDEPAPDWSAAVEVTSVEPPAPPDAPHEHVDPPAEQYLDPPGEGVEQPHGAAELQAGHDPALDAWFSHSPDPTDETPDPHAWPAPATAAGAAAAAEHRPGFFARLFRKRAAAKSAAEQLPDAEQPPQLSSPHEDLVSDAQIPEPEVGASEPEGPTVTPEGEPVADLAEAVGTAEAEREPDFDSAPVAMEPEPEPEPTPVSASAVAIGPTDSAVAAPDGEPEPGGESDAEPAPHDQVTAAAGDQVELLDHARAEAVLTAVLDDLGAARHRPFSRG